MKKDIKSEKILSMDFFFQKMFKLQENKNTNMGCAGFLGELFLSTT